MSSTALAADVTNGWLSHDANVENACKPHRVCRSLWDADKKLTVALDEGPDRPVCWTVGNFPPAYFPCDNNGERLSHKNRQWTLHIEYYGRIDEYAYKFTESGCKAVMLNYIPPLSTCRSSLSDSCKNVVRDVSCYEEGSQQP
jgi:hypothetical protein